jgi:hypothetical protein
MKEQSVEGRKRHQPSKSVFNSFATLNNVPVKVVQKQYQEMNNPSLSPHERRQIERLNAYSTLVPTQPRILKEPSLKTIDFSRAEERKFTYLQDIPQVHENRFNYVKLPAIATKNVKVPTITNYQKTSEQSYEERREERRIREASIIELDVKLSQVLPRPKVVPFKKSKFMSELRHVSPEEPTKRRRHLSVDVGPEDEPEPYEVNEQTMFAIRMQQEYALLRKMSPAERLAFEQQKI